MKRNDAAASVPGHVGAKAWFVVAMAACTQAINQIDKAVVGLAAEPIMRELSLSPAEYGLVAGSLFALFAVGGIAIGFLAAPRFTPRAILIVLLLLWSLAQLPIVFAASLSVLIACRVILGAAEGGGTATCVNVCHEWFPDDRRELPSALIIVGGTVGTLLAAPSLTYVIAVYGWRYAFLACSLAGIVILCGWMLFRRDGPYAVAAVQASAGAPEAMPLRRLFRERTIVGITLVGFCAFWVVGFNVAWLAPYVRDQLGFSPMQSGWILSLIYFGQSVVVLAVAGLSQWLLTLSFSSRAARGHVMAGCLLGSAACFVAMAVAADASMRLVLVTLATGLVGGVFPLSSAMISEVAPPANRYGLMTIILALITLSALVSPPITGAMIDFGRVHGWRPALLLIAGVAAAGAVLALWLLHPAQTIRALADAARA